MVERLESLPARIRIPFFRILLLACIAILVQGYHFGVDDAEIYIPAVARFADPHLYPVGAQFFLSHARLSIFAPLVGWTARVAGGSVEYASLFWYIACVFLLLVAAWQLSTAFFNSQHARWGSVALLGAVMPTPVAGTALAIQENYLTARSFSAPLALLSVGCLVRGKIRASVGWLVLTALFHPQMAVYCAALNIIYWLVQHPWKPKSYANSLGLFITTHLFPKLQSAEGNYKQLLYTRTFFFAQLWHWYEWIGVIVPLLILAYLAYAPSRPHRSSLRYLSKALVILTLLSTLVFLIISANHSFDPLTPLQPMRTLHLLYMILFVILGGFLGEHLLKASTLRWTALFAALSVGMYASDRSAYRHSSHIELPSLSLTSSTNPWLQAFSWIRDNTPKDAVFALDPGYMAIPGEDRHGFHALAQRSAPADAYKYSGVVVMFPSLLSAYEADQQLEKGWKTFADADFHRLAQVSRVTWVVVDRSQQGKLTCPYTNDTVAVCHI